ncbi:MAG: hypothetical protein Q9167_006621 [Letrouitia subvulpina]
MTLPTNTRQWTLTNKPTATPVLSGPNPTFTLETKPVPSLTDNQVLLRTLYLSNDPAQRGWISATVDPVRLYRPPVQLNSPMDAVAIAEVLHSTSPAFKAGQRVRGMTGWSEYAVLDAAKCQPLPALEGVAPTQHLGSLGPTGLTAWFGITEIARAGPADAVVVSGAAGATGSMVVQIAKHILGCKRVVGIAGADAKCRWVESLGADECLNYKHAAFRDELVRATDGFVEVYFDNVGGEILDLMLTRMKRHGRIAACGMVADYNSERSQTYGIKNWFEVISNRLEIRGFIVMDFLAEKGNAAMEALAKGLAEGKIKVDGQNETVVETAFEKIPETWMKLFEGANQGKLITHLV